MGNIRQALNLITDKIKDVNQAIEFCKEHNDEELWEDLIQHSLDKPGIYIFAILILDILWRCTCCPSLRIAFLDIKYGVILNVLYFPQFL